MTVKWIIIQQFNINRNKFSTMLGDCLGTVNKVTRGLKFSRMKQMLIFLTIMTLTGNKWWFIRDLHDTTINITGISVFFNLLLMYRQSLNSFFLLWCVWLSQFYTELWRLATNLEVNFQNIDNDYQFPVVSCRALVLSQTLWVREYK